MALTEVRFSVRKGRLQPRAITQCRFGYRRVWRNDCINVMLGQPANLSGRPAPMSLQRIAPNATWGWTRDSAMRNQLLTGGEKFGIILEDRKQIQFLYWCLYVFKGAPSFALDTQLTATLHSSPCTERPLEGQIQVPIPDKCERYFKKRLLFYWSSCRVSEHRSSHRPLLYLADLEGKAPVSNSGYTQSVLASGICGLYIDIKIIWHVTPCNLVERYQLCVGACSPNLQGTRYFLAASSSNIFAYIVLSKVSKGLDRHFWGS